MTDIRIEDAQSIPLRGLKPHPANARRGDVDLIEQSLTAHGQYAPIVVNQDNVILAGHHVVQAARRLKWTKIDAVRVTTTDEQALGILLADNRTADLATYHQPRLVALLESLDTLDGTGYGPADIAALDAMIGGQSPDAPEQPQEGTGGPEAGEAGSPYTEFRIGRSWAWEIPTPDYESWRDNVIGDVTRPRAVATLKRLLGLPTPTKPPATQPHIPLTDVTLADPRDLKPHPGNAREGDLGAVIESLTTFGQYKPITANIQTGHVVKGNHTHQAILTLGWPQIAVRWINVDEQEETKILLIDNRTSDLAGYDPATLKTTLQTLRRHTGTGYSPDDVDDILSGGAPKPGPPPTGQTAFKIGQYGWRTPTDVFEQWADGLDGTIIRHRLRLPEDH